jgi:phosphoglycolate phosphatase-like HAD superfamily hydrolase
VHSQGLLIGIVTATHRFSFECDLDEHAIPRETLSYTQTADESPFHKPDPRVFDQAIRWLAGLNIRPDEALYIGDSLYDFAAAGGAGFKFLGVETGLITAAQFRENGASSIPSIGCLLPGES